MYTLMHRLAYALAIIGGLVLSLLVVMTCLSIVGRELAASASNGFLSEWLPGVAAWIERLGINQIKGDAELTEAGMAFAIFCFLPLCNLTAGHATVDLLVSRFPKPVKLVLRMLAEIGFAIVMVLIAWKLFDGTMAKYRNGETSWLLQFPLWWAYALSLGAAIVAAIVAIYVAVMSVAEALTGRVYLPAGSGAEH